MSDVCMCETIDALGLAGFDKAFNSIEAISEGRRADLLHVRLLMHCPAVVLLLVDVIITRSHRVGNRVTPSPCLPAFNWQQIWFVIP